MTSSHSQGFEAWLVKFLFGMLSRFWPYIEPNGHVAIHMSDDWEYKICEPMCLFAESRLRARKLIYCFSPRICSRTLMGERSTPSFFSRGGSLLPSALC